MAEETKVIKYVDLEALGVSTQLIKQYVDKKDEKSLKTAILDEEKGVLNLYTTEQPIADDAVAAFSIELPKTDISALMHKLSGATTGNVVTVGENGEVTDGGVALSDIATKEYVGATVAEEIGKTQHLTSQIVTELPADADAKANVIYLIKDADATGTDVYKEYLVIDGKLTCVGDTSTDLSNVYTKDTVDGKISTAKQEAIDAAATDATSKADQALTDAKSYTDQEVGKVSESVETNTSDISTLKTDVSDLQTTSSQYGDRITALESGMPEIEIATEDDVKDALKDILV